MLNWKLTLLTVPHTNKHLFVAATLYVVCLTLPLSCTLSSSLLIMCRWSRNSTRSKNWGYCNYCGPVGNMIGSFYACLYIFAASQRSSLSRRHSIMVSNVDGSMCFITSLMISFALLNNLSQQSEVGGTCSVDLYSYFRSRRRLLFIYS